MKTKSSSRQRHQKQQDPVRNITDKTMRNYDRTVKTGVRFQEEATQWWMRLMNQAASATDWQKRVTGLFAVTDKLMPSTQKRLLEIMELMDMNSRAGAELMNKAVDAVQTASLTGSQSKWLEFWTSSLGAMRSNLEALSQINNRVIDSWIDMARENTEFAQTSLSKAA